MSEKLRDKRALGFDGPKYVHWSRIGTYQELKLNSFDKTCLYTHGHFCKTRKKAVLPSRKDTLTSISIVMSPKGAIQKTFKNIQFTHGLAKST